MAKFKSKLDVIEWYWPDYLEYCIRNNKDPVTLCGQPIFCYPTINGFWDWYISSGPLGLKSKGLFYTKEDVEYV